MWKVLLWTFYKYFSKVFSHIKAFLPGCNFDQNPSYMFRVILLSTLFQQPLWCNQWVKPVCMGFTFWGNALLLISAYVYIPANSTRMWLNILSSTSTNLGTGFPCGRSGVGKVLHSFAHSRILSVVIGFLPCLQCRWLGTSFMKYTYMKERPVHAPVNQTRDTLLV